MSSPPQYRLRLRDREEPLPSGDFVVGRSAECDLVLDDPVASRRHAMFRVMPTQVVLEDLGSRNGVLVNGVRMFEPTPVHHGDRVLVGGTEMRLVEVAAVRRREEMATRPLNVSGVRERDVPQAEWESATDVGSVYDVLIAACDRAFLHAGIDEACAAVRNLLLSVRAGVLRRQLPDAPTLRAATGFAIQLAERTEDVSWLDRLFEVLVASRTVPDAQAMERLTRLIPRLGAAGVESARGFVGRMQPLADLGADAHERLSRLDATVRRVGT